MTERRLLHRLAIAVGIKLVVLALLWWAFVRDHATPVDAQAAAAHLVNTSTTPRPAQEGHP